MGKTKTGIWVSYADLLSGRLPYRRKKLDMKVWQEAATRMALLGDDAGLLELRTYVRSREIKFLDELLLEISRIKEESKTNASLAAHIARWLANPDAYRVAQETYTAQEFAFPESPTMGS
jgi:hypothetical protein